MQFNFNTSFPVFKSLNSYENYEGKCILKNICQEIHLNNNYNYQLNNENKKNKNTNKSFINIIKSYLNFNNYFKKNYEDDETNNNLKKTNTKNDNNETNYNINNNNNIENKNNDNNNDDKVKKRMIEIICSKLKDSLSKKIKELKEMKEQSIACKQIEINKSKIGLLFNLPNDLKELNIINKILNENENKIKDEINIIKKNLRTK